MIHGGLVWNEPKYVNLLAQNQYFVVPVVNVDGFADIESIYNQTGQITTRRKNMNFENA